MISRLTLASGALLLLAACETRQPQTVTAKTTAAVPADPAAPTAEVAATATPAAALPDGSALYAANCQMCHQATGLGLTGAFPPLKGSPVVNNADAAKLTTIILHGYDARPEYGAMPGYAASLTDEKVAAVATHVRQAWGNTGGPVTADFVRELRAATAR